MPAASENLILLLETAFCLLPFGEALNVHMCTNVLKVLRLSQKKVLKIKLCPQKFPVSLNNLNMEISILFLWFI